MRQEKDLRRSAGRTSKPSSPAQAGRDFRETAAGFSLTRLLHRPDRLPAVAFPMIGAVLLWAALPPLDWWPLAWIAPAWWVWLVRQERLPGSRPYVSLWAIGFVFWLAALHWLRLPHWATSFGWIALSFYFAFYLPLFVGLSRIAVYRLRMPMVLAAPVVWTGLELARAHVLTGMTMASLGHTQYRWIELIQVSDVTGGYGVSCIVMFAAACLAQAMPCAGRRWAVWPVAAALAVVGAALGYGYWRISGAYSEPGARIALIQGSIDSELKFDSDRRDQVYEHYLELSKQAVQQHGPVDLVVWPETMFRDTLITFDSDAPVPAGFDGSQAEWIECLKVAAERSERLIAYTARTLKTPLVLGVDTQDYRSQSVRYFNSALQVARDGKILGRYDKMHLVMFGEYVPLEQYLPWLQRFTPMSVSNTPGERPVMFEVAGSAGAGSSATSRQVRLAPNICFETVIPHIIRAQVTRLRALGQEPDVLVNLTNDGWFWGSSELDMHLACGVFRAIECRKPLVIAANTGFSASIDSDGRILAQGPRRDTAALVAEVHLDQRRSWYLDHGDWPAGICLAACAVFAGIGAWQRRGTAN